MNRERSSKQELLERKRRELREKEREIKAKFEAAETSRKEMEKKVQKIMSEREKILERDIETEKKNRFESVQHIKSCLRGDFPKL